MNRIQKKFEYWNRLYSSKRLDFKKKIDLWISKGKSSIGSKSSQMLSDLDFMAQNLKKEFAQNKEVTSDIKKSVKIFRRLYKELNEITKPVWRQWGEALLVAVIAVFLLKTFVFGLYFVPTGSAEVNLLVGDRVWGNNMAYSFGSKPKHGDLIMFANQDFKYDKNNKLKCLWQKYVGLPISILGIEAGPDNIVKRVIACPGDTVEGRLEDGKPVIYLNGKKLYEPYLNKYPLIALKKNSGFFDFDKFIFFPVPAFLRYKSELNFFSYDPLKNFLNQPFYRMDYAEKILNPETNQPWLLMPNTLTEHDGKIVDVFGPIIVPEGKYWGMGDNRKNSKDARFFGFIDEDRIYGRASFVVYSIDSAEPFWLFEFIKRPISFWTQSIRWKRFFKSLKIELARFASSESEALVSVK